MEHLTDETRAKLAEIIEKEGNLDFFMYRGYPCFLMRNAKLWCWERGFPEDGLGTFNWCGYVGVPKWHPLYKKHYDLPDVLVHGGLTYSGFMFSSKDFWFFGFDCAHSGDLCRDMGKNYNEYFWSKYPEYSPKNWKKTMKGSMWKDTYKTKAYVKAEINSMADQIAMLENVPKISKWGINVAWGYRSLEKKFEIWKLERDLRSGRALEKMKKLTERATRPSLMKRLEMSLTAIERSLKEKIKKWWTE